MAFRFEKRFRRVESLRKAARTTPERGALVARNHRRGGWVVLRDKRMDLLDKEEGEYLESMGSKTASEVLALVEKRVADEDGALKEDLDRPVPREVSRALMAPKDSYRVRKMRKMLRVSPQALEMKKKRAESVMAGHVWQTYHGGEEGMRWTAGESVKPGPLRWVTSPPEEDVEMQDAPSQMVDEDDPDARYASQGGQGHDENSEEEDEKKAEEDDDEEEEEDGKWISRQNKRYNLRRRPAVDYRSAYKYAYAT